MKRPLKIGLRILAVLLVLLLLIFAGSWIYLKNHKKELIAFIESEAAKGLNGGTLHIGDINIGFGHTFPRLAFTIDTLVLRDSLWSHHHHDLINADRAYASLNFFKLIVGSISVGRVEVESPRLYIFTDSSGYESTSVFKKNNPPKKDAPRNLEYPVVEITNGLLNVEMQNMHKFFEFKISSLEAVIHGRPEGPSIDMDVKMLVQVHKMTFNLERGSYLAGKTVTGGFPVQFDKEKKILSFDSILLSVDAQPFRFSGKFFLAEKPAPFILNFSTDNLSFRKAASFLADNIQEKLQPYDITETIDHIEGSLDNSETKYLTPLVHLRLNVHGRTVVTAGASLQNASFTATFNNEEVPGKGHEDSNTVMHFAPLTASLDGLPLTSDSIVIHNLIHPNADLHLLSNFRLPDLNGLVDTNSISFQNGKGLLDFSYRGSLEANYDSLRMIAGSLQLDSASIRYGPRNMLFTRGKGRVRFDNKDILIDSLHLNTGTTDLLLNGQIRSIFYLINKKNKKIAFDCTIRSNKLNLNDFLSFLKQKSTRKKEVIRKKGIEQTIAQLSGVLDTADFNIDLRARELVYRKFYGSNLVARLQLTNNALVMQQISLNHSMGSVKMDGVLKSLPASNPFELKAQLKNIDVSKIFYAFNSFGLSSPTDKNLRGAFFADINLKGGFTEKAALIPGELTGSVKFNLQQGALINFEPMQKISQFAFKDRDFSNIQFADLHDVFDINGEEITINRMEIHSSVLVMFVEGTYNMKTGPDLSMVVPLSNLGKMKKDSVLENKGVHTKKGISARLRAKTGSDGKVKFSWDPFNNFAKEQKKKQAGEK